VDAAPPRLRPAPGRLRPRRSGLDAGLKRAVSPPARTTGRPRRRGPARCSPCR
jgi:hypothetical protein